MGKNRIYKKVVATLIAIISISSIAFAESAPLTYEEAVKLAIRNNHQIKRVTQEIDDLDIKLTTPSNIPNEVFMVMPSLSAQLTQSSFRLSNAHQAKKLEFEGVIDALELQLKNSFHQIEYLNKSIDFKEKKIIDALDKTINTDIKYRYGVASRFEAEQGAFDIKKEREELASQKLSLEKEKDNLRQIIGIKNFDREIVPIEAEFISTDKLQLNPNFQVAKAIANSASIFYQQKSIEEAELNRLLAHWEFYEAANTPAQFSLTPIPVRESEIRLKDIELRSQKEQLEFSIRETYNTLKSLETAITQMENQIEKVSKDVDAMKVRFEVGIVTQRDVKTLEMALEELVFNLEKLKADHTMVRMQYERPHLIMGR